jgi:dTDP-4-amino-4,6-dideoxygalactose transaminase
MIVHWGGYPVDLDRLRRIQESASAMYGSAPPVIEDCAHAWASTYQGRLLGNHGNLCVFSFQAIKHLTAGDGGLLVLPDETLYRRAKLLRWFGIDRENRADFRCESDIAEYGFKFHMNDINATIGIANLQIVDDVVKRHRENAAYYDEHLRDVPGIRLLERSPDRSSSFWLYTMHVERRDDFVRKLTGAGIAVSRVHERNDIHSCVREYAAMLPNLDRVIRTMICIPTGWWVTPDDREHIVQTIRAGW